MLYGSPTLVYTGNYHPHWSSYFVSNNHAFFLFVCLFFVFSFFLFFLSYVFQNFTANLQCLAKVQLDSIKKLTANVCNFVFLEEE